MFEVRNSMDNHGSSVPTILPTYISVTALDDEHIYEHTSGGVGAAGRVARQEVLQIEPQKPQVGVPGRVRPLLATNKRLHSYRPGMCEVL